MNFIESIKRCLTQYATFRGRAPRPEFWWFMLFCTVISIVTGAFGDRISGFATLLLLLPALAVSARRLHDIGRSGWWQLLGLLPVIGVLVVLYWYVQPSQACANKYGD